MGTVSGERDFGDTESETLTFSRYIASATAKANRVLGIIRHFFLLCRNHTSYYIQLTSAHTLSNAYKDKLRELCPIKLKERREKGDLIRIYKNYLYSNETFPTPPQSQTRTPQLFQWFRYIEVGA